jgi:putative restriction endonuclease
LFKIINKYSYLISPNSIKAVDLCFGLFISREQGLEAAHIKPYAVAGPHTVSNGLLLRSDVHKLFDTGYLTITNQHKTEVSKRIKEEFENGKEYYQFYGRSLLYLPEEIANRPKAEFIQWHNQNVYKG